MPELTLIPSQALSITEVITEIVIRQITCDPTKDTLKLVVSDGNRSHVVTINNAASDPEATPPVIGDYDAVVALVDVPAMTALLQSRIESAIAQ